MIFPIFGDWPNPNKVIATILFFTLNIFVFILTVDDFRLNQTKIEKLLDDDHFLRVNGQVFAQYIAKNPSQFDELYRRLSEKVFSGDRSSAIILGAFGFRHVRFMSEAESLQVSGDDVEIKDWQRKVSLLRDYQSKHPSFQWGVSSASRTPASLITYQFSHSGEAHLFWNMLFLLLFGSFAEVTLGTSLVILTYVTAGVFGAMAFAWLSGVTTSPLVGASASVSGLVGLIVAYFGNERLRFFYWLLPHKNYYGTVMLPSWTVLLLFMVPDLAGYLSAVEGFSPVAHAAHLGGLLAGFFMGFALRSEWLKRDEELEDGQPS